MTSIVLPSIQDARYYGYDELPDPDDLYHSPQWLTMDESIGIAAPFSVVSVPDGRPPQARAATWGLVVEDTAFWPFMRIDHVLGTLLDERQIARTAATEQMLAALMPNAYLGALRGGTTRLPVRADLAGPRALEAVGEVLDGAEEMARTAGVRSVAFFYVPPEELVLRRALVQRGYTEFGPNHNVAVLGVRGQNFDDYLSGFGKRRRDSIKWERRKIAAAGVQIGCEELTSDLSRQMLPLEAQLYAKYGHHVYPEEMARILHEAVIIKYGGSAPVITARADGALRGYAAFIQLNNALYSRDTGYDYTWPVRLPLYFEVLFYSAIELAMKSGVREIHYSYGSEETKVSRGCDLRPRLGYLKALDPDAAAELARLSPGLAPPDAAVASGRPVGHAGR
jgi:uncharacterized protein